MYVESTTTVIRTSGTEKPISPTPSKVWRAKLTIINMVFTEGLTDPSSEEFAKLASDLEDALDNIFKEVSGFLFVKVVNFTKGSIVCNYLIHTKLESSATSDEFNKILSEKRGKIGKFEMETEEEEEDGVAAVKGTQPRKDEFPLKVFAAAAFGGLVAMVIGFVLYKVSICKCFVDR